MTDRELIEMFKNRDEGAIRAAQEKYRGYCLAIAANYLALNEDREECVSDAMLALWNQIPPDDPKSFSAYLAAIVRTLALERSRDANAWKRGGRVQIVGEEFLSDLTDGRTLADDYESSRAGAVINDFLDSLSKNERKIFILRYWFDEDILAIARKTGFSDTKIKSLLKRLRDRLREKLNKEGITL